MGLHQMRGLWPSGGPGAQVLVDTARTCVLSPRGLFCAPPSTGNPPPPSDTHLRTQITLTH